MDKVWKLPPNVRQAIIHRMKFEDVFELSLRSVPFRNFMKENKMSGLELVWTFEKDGCDIELKNDESPESVWITFQDESESPSTEDSDKEDEEDYDEDDPDEEHPCLEDSDVEDEEGAAEDLKIRFKMEDSEIAPVNGDMKIMTIKRDRNKFQVEDSEDYAEKLKAMEAMSKYIAEIAHVKYSLNHSQNPDVNIFKSFVFKTTKTFFQVTIGQVEHVRARLRILTAQQLHFIFEQLDIEELDLTCRLKRGEVLGNITFHQKTLFLNRCDWIQPIDLQNNTRLEYFNGRFPRHGLADFVGIVEAWQKGTHFQSLEDFSFGYRVPSGRRELRIQTDGTLALVWTGTRFKYPMFNGSIKRVTDGKLAEVRSWMWNGQRNDRPPLTGAFSIIVKKRNLNVDFDGVRDDEFSDEVYTDEEDARDLEEEDRPDLEALDDAAHQ